VNPISSSVELTQMIFAPHHCRIRFRWGGAERCWWQWGGMPSWL